LHVAKIARLYNPASDYVIILLPVLRVLPEQVLPVLQGLQGLLLRVLPVLPGLLLRVLPVLQGLQALQPRVLPFLLLSCSLLPRLIKKPTKAR
jgi:hypothetical protein